MDYKLTEDGLYAYEYPRASVTADAVLFAEKDGQMYVLLIQRGNEPYKGYWAFPGGFLEMDETVADDAAAAKWWPLNELPPLAFDHNKILAGAMRMLKLE